MFKISFTLHTRFTLHYIVGTQTALQWWDDKAVSALYIVILPATKQGTSKYASLS